MADALGTLGQSFARNQNHGQSATFRIEVEGTPRTLHPIIRDEVYRIAGEALRNAFRHAQARQVKLEVHCDERQLRLHVRDNGKGMDMKIFEQKPLPGHFGMPGMRGRALGGLE